MKKKSIFVKYKKMQMILVKVLYNNFKLDDQERGKYDNIESRFYEIKERAILTFK